MIQLITSLVSTQFQLNFIITPHDSYFFLYVNRHEVCVSKGHAISLAFCNRSIICFAMFVFLLWSTILANGQMVFVASSTTNQILLLISTDIEKKQTAVCSGTC